MNDSKNNQTENEQKGLKKFFKKFSLKDKFNLKVIRLFLIALSIVIPYILLGLKYGVFFSDIARNLWLLFFAIFGGGLAIWGRKATQTQLENTERQLQLTAKQSEHTERQLKNSAKINRNDRFAKAVEMLSNDKSKISARGGLHILRDLIEENPNSEYVRCVDIISYWLVEHGGIIGKPLLDVAIIIIRLRELLEDVEEFIDEHKEKNILNFWPNLQNVNLEGADLEGLKLPKADMLGANLKSTNLIAINLKGTNLEGASLKDAYIRMAGLEGARLKGANLQGAIVHGNLQGANLRNANLEEADLIGVNLEGANLTNANLSGADLTDGNLQGARLMGADFEFANLENVNLQDADLENVKMKSSSNLTKEQILSAKWTGIKQPHLPNEFENHPDVRKWLWEYAPDKEDG